MYKSNFNSLGLAWLQWEGFQWLVVRRILRTKLLFNIFVFHFLL